jgi:hypothetical protein
MTKAMGHIRRGMRIARALATDSRIPRWLRILLAIGCVQIPVLPVDEICLATALAILVIRYRAVLLAIVKEA